MAKKLPILQSYINHKSHWEKCSICDIGKHSVSRIFFRGVFPADILIVGEAPSDTDLVLNKPFSGPAGKLLTKILDEAFNTDSLTFCMTYSILCAPSQPPQFKIRQPKETEIRNCNIRLQQFYDLVKPKHVIAAGRIGEKAIKRLRGLTSTNPPEYTLIPNPISILNQAEQGTLDYKRAVHSLKEINI